MIIIIIIAMFILLLFFFLFFKVSIEKIDIPTLKIDAVITWVNGKDENFKNQVIQYRDYENERFDMNEELRFCLRSIEKNMRFINKIFIVIKDNQFPHFLKKKHFQIEFVRHSQIIPRHYLPTFNSISIENFIHKIPGLSEHFIYFNDDMILLQECHQSMFFTKNSVIHTKDDKKSHEALVYKYWDKKTKKIEAKFKPQRFIFSNFINQNNELLDLIFWKEKRFRSQHIPYACKISFLDELDELIKTIEHDGTSLYEHSGMHKFRDMRSIARFSIFKKYVEIYMNNAIEKQYSIIAIVINEKEDKLNEIKEIKKSSDVFLVIHNETIKENDISIKNFNALKEVLSECFPLKSSYEI
jgi:hypothetical protein